MTLRKSLSVTIFNQASLFVTGSCCSTENIAKRNFHSDKLGYTMNGSKANGCNEKNKDDILKCLINMSKANQRRLKISIEGNIASGKSSIVEYLRRKLSLSPSKNVVLSPSNLNNASLGQQQQQQQDDTPPVNLKLITEPVNLWRNLGGNNLLELMYSDPHRWAFAFHSYVQLTMLEKHLELNQSESIVDLENVNSQSCHNLSKCNISIMERSLYSAKYCFVENIFKSKILMPVEYEILDKWFNFMIDSHDCSLDVIFYLRTRPDTCLTRLRSRARPEETSTVTLEYLENLHEMHESWLVKEQINNNKLFYRPSLIIVIDGNQSLDDVYKTIEVETRNALSSLA
jgi:deoxyadenosine/deoxycytidine kinase